MNKYTCMKENIPVIRITIIRAKPEKENKFKIL